MRRRVFPRYTVNRSISVDIGSGPMNAELVDLSMRGGGLRAGDNIAVGQRLTVILSDRCTLPARAIYKSEGTVGVLFDAMSKAEVAELRRFIFEVARGHDVVTSVERTDLRRATAGQRDGVYLQLDDVADRVFAHVEAETRVDARELLSSFVDQGDLLATIHVFRNREQEPVGFCALTASTAPGATGTMLVRARAAVLPEYRGANLMMGPLLSEVVRLRAAHPTQRALFLVEALDPSLFRLFATHDATLLDDRREPAGRELEQLAASAWGKDVLHGPAGGVLARTGLRVLSDDESDAAWSSDPLVGPFLEKNPDRKAGIASMALVSLDAESMARLLLRYAARQAQKRVSPSSAVAVRLEDGDDWRTDAYGPWVRRSLIKRALRRIRR